MKYKIHLYKTNIKVFSKRKKFFFGIFFLKGLPDFFFFNCFFNFRSIKKYFKSFDIKDLKEKTVLERFFLKYKNI